MGCTFRTSPRHVGAGRDERRHPAPLAGHGTQSFPNDHVLRTRNSPMSVYHNRRFPPAPPALGVRDLMPSRSPSEVVPESTVIVTFVGATRQRQSDSVQRICSPIYARKCGRRQRIYHLLPAEKSTQNSPTRAVNSTSLPHNPASRSFSST